MCIVHSIEGRFCTHYSCPSDITRLTHDTHERLQLPLAMHEYYMPSSGGGHFSHTCLHLLLLLEVLGTLARLLLLCPLALFEELRTWKNACCLAQSSADRPVRLALHRSARQPYRLATYGRWPYTHRRFLVIE